MKQLLFCFSLLLASVTAIAQDSFTCRAQRYIAQYSCYAMTEQKRCGVPASVTLAQGVLETEAGKSELVSLANNHFGIKCKNDYQGPKVYHDDDRPQECFKMYRSAEDSYKDHSDYLKRNRRYEPLFNYHPTDYTNWAKGLKKCGYATNPIYAQRLIKIIEDFNLQEYTLKALDNTTPEQALLVAANPLPDTKDTSKTVQVAETPKPRKEILLAAQPKAFAAMQAADTTKKPAPAPTADAAKNDAPVAAAAVTPVAAHPVVTDSAKPAPVAPVAPNLAGDVKFDSGKVIVMNGLKAFYANKGEMLLQYAVKYKIRYQKLLEINELPDAPLTANTLVYLEKKHNEGTHAKHTVKEGETLFMIAQEEGIVLKRLLTLNMLDQNDEPAIGTILELQNGATRKPALRATPAPDLTTTNNRSFVQPTPPDAFVQVTHAAPADTTKAIVKKEVNRDTYVTTIHTTIDSGARTETVPAKPMEPAPVKNEVAQVTTDTVKDELASLKAKLDKVVYPEDNSQVKKDKPVKSEPIILSPIDDRPVKPKKEPKQKPVVAAAAAGDDFYTVKKGDNLFKIAESNNTTVAAILAVNDIEADELHLGQKLRMPGTDEPVRKTKPAAHVAAEPKTAKYYTVKKGDNLSNIAENNNTTVAAILAVNDIDADDLHLGQKLHMPGADEATHKAKPAHAATESKTAKYYTVKNGDNLSNIAKRQHTTIKEIVRLNKIDADELHLGQQLRLK